MPRIAACALNRRLINEGSLTCKGSLAPADPVDCLLRKVVGVRRCRFCIGASMHACMQTVKVKVESNALI
jgi:hypothetical protein